MEAPPAFKHRVILLLRNKGSGRWHFQGVGWPLQDIQPIAWNSSQDFAETTKLLHQAVDILCFYFETLQPHISTAV